MASHVCPWWGGYFIDNRLRRLFHNPDRILEPFVKPGMTVLDVGCGMGLFSIAAARIVGENGLVIAADLQQQMLEVLQDRARRAGVADRIRTHRCETNRIGVEASVDFAIAFAVVHETPDTEKLLQQIHSCLNAGGLFFVAEPRIHVPARTFGKMLSIARRLGFIEHKEPRVRLCRAVVLAKS